LIFELVIVILFLMDNQQPQPTQEDKEVQIGKYKVKVIRSLCISAAACLAVSPTVFEFDAENKAIIKPGATDSEQNILMAAQSCPTKAIIITDAQTGQQVWPA
jgi:ferredoxin